MQVTALLVDNRDSQTVYASTDCAGVFKSSDGGHSWTPANAGLEPHCGWSYALALDPTTPRIVYAADRVRGVLKSLDGGARWHATNKGLSLTTVSSLAVDPQNPRTVYASAGPLGLFKSSDIGAHWRPLASGPHLVEGIALDPSNPRNILVVAAGVRCRQEHRRRPHLDRGNASAPTHERWPWLRSAEQTAYAGTNGHGLFGSTDGGRSWRPLGPPGAVHVQALAISPADPAVVYAGVWGSKTRGLYKSTDGGSSWQRLTDALDIDVSAIALDPENPTTVYIARGSRRRLQEHRRRRHLAAGELGPAAATVQAAHRQVDHLHGRRDRPRDRSRHTPRRCTRPPVGAASSEARTLASIGTRSTRASPTTTSGHSLSMQPAKRSTPAPQAEASSTSATTHSG